MLPASTLSEAVRNVASGTTRAVILFAIWSALLICAVLSDQLAIRMILDGSNAFRSSGASVSVMIANGRVEGSVCDSLNQLPNVRAAGALRLADNDLVAATMPSSPIPTFEVSSGLVAILTSRAGSGVFVSRDLANGLGTSAGDPFYLTGGEKTEVAGVFDYPTDGRRPGLAYSVLETVAPTGYFDECWVDIWPRSDEVLSLMGTTVGPASQADEPPPQLTQLNSTLGVSFPAVELFRDRPTANLPLYLVAGGGLLGFFAVWTRKLELASARHLGVTSGAQMAQMTIEASVWLCASSLVAFAVACVLGTFVSASDLMSLLVPSLIMIGAGAVANIAATILTVSWIDGTHYLIYFRDRQ